MINNDTVKAGIGAENMFIIGNIMGNTFEPLQAGKEKLVKEIDDLDKNPDDKVRVFGDISVSAVGIGLGGAAAGTVAGVAGATAIPVVTTAASWIGVSIVAATPVGWVVGAAVVGGLLAHGCARLIRNGARIEGKKKEMLQSYREKLRDILIKERLGSITDDDRSQFRNLLKQLIMGKFIEPDDAQQLLHAVEHGLMPISEANAIIDNLLKS